MTDSRALAIAFLFAAAATAQQPSFRNDVMPILTKAGCNAGSCHGAAAGKNGFPLSLFGYDPERDHTMLTRDLRGRRLDVADPDRSLMLQKATARVPHKGGKRIDADGDLYTTLRSWIAAGASDDGATAPALTSIAIAPSQSELVLGTGDLALVVTAHYADGSRRDVSALALWSSTNDGALAVDGHGHASPRGQGEAYVLARYGAFAVVAQVQVHADANPFAWPAVREHGFVDELVDQKLRRARVLPAELCSDEVFVRRVFLDLLDVLPTAAETRAFLADTAADKRARLVDTLLERPEFAAVQAMSWADVLLVDDQTMEQKGAALLSRWLTDAFLQHRPIDEIVRDLLTADGPTFREPAANFALAQEQPNLLAEHTAQAFLGIRMQCAQCHNHPFENWTMDDYYGFAAFFGQLGRKRAEDPTEWIVFDRQNGDVRHKRDGRVMAPKPLAAPAPKIAAGTDRRAALAQWLTGGDNPFFARHVANRVFARLFGRGIVDPPDDVRLSNPPSHPELLLRLAQLLVDSKFDVRPLVRTLCASRVYQSSAPPVPTPPALFAGNAVRRLSAEQLLAAIDKVTGVPTRLPGLPVGAAATGLASGRSQVRFLELFGRPARSSACTCERSNEPGLGQTLHLENGDTIAQKLADRGSRLQRAIAAKTAPTAMLEDLFVAAYARAPRADEQDRLLATVQAATDDKARLAAWQDIYWAVLNSKEFVFQH